jgi:cytochrome c
MRVLLILAATLLASPAMAADGGQVFANQCATCHGSDGGGGEMGPSLKGVAGRPVASLPDFSYSDALKAKGGVWSDAALDGFLADPQTAVPGTAMYGGAPDPADRKAVIDYLKTLK